MKHFEMPKPPYLGAAYYPEDWDDDQIDVDVAKMVELGLKVVRIGEFAWHRMEPKPGEFDFTFFHTVIDKLKAAGIAVIMGTPTATPPRWLSRMYPHVFRENADGREAAHGGRRHCCSNNPHYDAYSLRIVEKMAQEFADDPAVIGWQIDNEVNCETNSYHAPSDHEAFRKYLKEKYGTLENLNRAMGTTFWNQTYTDWEQVHLSRYTLANSNNPHMMLEEKRFISEAAINYIGIQADNIRKYRRSEQFITTNGLFGVLDNHKLVKEKLDFITYDSYPNFAFAMEGCKLSPRSLRDRETSFNLA